MMFRCAAVRPDGTIARVITASSVAAVEQNIPADAVKIEAPADVRFGTHTYDFSAREFRPVAASKEG
jgi:hypothetical protein